MRKKLTQDEIYDLQVGQQADQIEAWARDNKELLLDIFVDGMNVDDEDFSEGMTHAISWGLSQVLKDRNNPFYDSERIAGEGRKILKKITWKQVSLFLLSLFADEMIESLEAIHDGETVDDELKTDIALGCVMVVLADLKDKKTKFKKDE